MKADDQALLRLGARTARRNLGRSLLIVLLIAVPVGAAITVAAAQRALQPSAELQRSWHYGQGDLEIGFWLVAPGETISDTQRDDMLGGTVSPALADYLDWIEGASVESVMAELAADNAVAVPTGYFSLAQESVEVVAVDANDPVLTGMYDLVDGRYPEASGEVAVTARVADLMDVTVGDRIDVPGVGSAEVVGEHRLNSGTDTAHMVAAPSTPIDVQYLRVLVDDDDATDDPLAVIAGLADEQARWAAQEQGLLGVQLSDGTFGVGSAPLQLHRPSVLSGVVASVLLLEVALVAAAAFSTGARRRLREFGLLATVGAEPEHVRRLVLAEALVLGLAGGVAGVLVGIVGTRLFRPLIEALASHVVTDVGFGPTDVLAPFALAVVASVLAAWIPARTASRVAPTVALQGRMPVRPLRARVVPLGAAAIGFGLFVVAAIAGGLRGGDGASGAALVGIMFGALCCLAGSALLASWVVGAVGRRADRLPLSLRLVARDAGRQTFRSSVTVAGLVVALALPVMVTAVVVSAEADRSNEVPAALADEIVVNPAGGPGMAQEETVAEIEAQVDIVHQGRVPLLGVDENLGNLVSASVMAPDGGCCWSQTKVGVGTDEAVAALRLDPSVGRLLADGHAVGLGTPGPDVQLEYPVAAEDGLMEWKVDPITVQVVDARAYTWAAPSVLVPPAMVDELGMQVTDFVTVLAAASPLSSAQHDALTRIAIGETDATTLRPVDDDCCITNVFFAPGVDSISGTAQAIAVGVSALVVLVIGGCLIAVAATESDHDIATMVRVGAAPSLRRRFLALQSWYHAFLGALLAAPVGLLLLVALRQALTDPEPLAMPWPTIAAVVVLIPVLLALSVGLAVRSTPPVARLDL